MYPDVSDTQEPHDCTIPVGPLVLFPLITSKNQPFIWAIHRKSLTWMIRPFWVGFLYKTTIWRDQPAWKVAISCLDNFQWPPQKKWSTWLTSLDIQQKRNPDIHSWNILKAKTSAQNNMLFCFFQFVPPLGRYLPTGNLTGENREKKSDIFLFDIKKIHNLNL